jgi:hypothetical protein
VILSVFMVILGWFLWDQSASVWDAETPRQVAAREA